MSIGGWSLKYNTKLDWQSNYAPRYLELQPYNNSRYLIYYSSIAVDDATSVILLTKVVSDEDYWENSSNSESEIIKSLQLNTNNTN